MFFYNMGKKQKIILIFLLFLAFLTITVFSQNFKTIKKEKYMNSSQKNIALRKIKISSPAFIENGLIPKKYTCDGKDINPPLEIKYIPENTVSLALIIDDPDAPGGVWDHWIVWNINPKTTEIKENSLPEGAVEGLNSFGKHSYGGPCPPHGIHHYHFKIYALKKDIKLKPLSGKKELEKAMQGNIISQAEIIGLYKKE